MYEMLNETTWSSSLKQFRVSDTALLIEFSVPSRIFFQVSAPEVSLKTTPLALGYSAAPSPVGMTIIAIL